MYRLRHIAPLLLLSACTSEPPPASLPEVLRVSTIAPASLIDPFAGSGSILYFRELVFRPASEYFAAASVADGTLVLTPKANAPPPGLLAVAVRAKGIGPFVASGRSVRAALPEGLAPPPLGEIWVDLGPFEQVSVTKEKLTLRRRSGSGVGVIEVISTSGAEEEWRRLMGRHVDLVPEVAPSHLRYLAEVPSIHVVPIQQTATPGLLFNAKGPALSDVRLRRAISLALRRAAIAEVVAGDPSDAVPVDEDGDQARALVRAAGPQPLRVILYASQSDNVRAAMVLEQQLEEVGFRVSTRVLALDEMDNSLTRARDFDVALLFADFDPRYFGLLGVTGYASPEFDAAVAAGHSDRAIEVLKRDVPFTPLYRLNEGVALNAGWCGAHAKTATDLSWLADVHPCAEGETE